MRVSESTFWPPRRAITLSLAAWAALSLPLAGRIGERQGQIEDRLFADGVGQRLQGSEVAAVPGGSRGGGRRGGNTSTGRTSGKNLSGGRNFDISPIDNLLWQALGQTPPAADSNGLKKRPPEFPEYIYFKTDDGTPAAKKLSDIGTPTGWELRVYMYKQLSGIEVYRRVGPSLSDAEIEALLFVNRGSSAWTHTKVSASQNVSSDDDLSKMSFIGYDYQRNDGQVRALQVGNDFVVFSADLDRNLLEIKAAQSQPKTAKDAKPAAPAATHGTVNPVVIRGF